MGATTPEPEDEFAIGKDGAVPIVEVNAVDLVTVTSGSSTRCYHLNPDFYRQLSQRQLHADSGSL